MKIGVAVFLVAVGALAGVAFYRESTLPNGLFTSLFFNNIMSNGTGNGTMCDSYPCWNGGYCYAYGNYSYSCTCQSGFYGSNCQYSYSMSPCAHNPCSHGTCYPNGAYGFYCMCSYGYYGEQCQYSTVSSCQSMPCQNGATCYDSNSISGGYSCACTPGYYGSNCQYNTTLSACSSSPCANAGTCYDYGLWYSCTCQAGYYGNNCQFRSDNVCTMYSCMNGGTCVSYGNGGYQCYCPLGYSGSQCQSYIYPDNICYTSNPCFHGGSCIPASWSANSYTCMCPMGYSGVRCESSLYPTTGCDSSPCANGGTCLSITDVNNNPQSLCACSSGFAGKQCDLREVIVGGRSIYYTTDKTLHGFTWYWSAVATDAITNIQGSSGKNEGSETIALQKAIIDLFKALVSSTVLTADHPTVREAMARFRPVPFSDDIVHATLNVGADVA